MNTNNTWRLIMGHNCYNYLTKWSLIIILVLFLSILIPSLVTSNQAPPQNQLTPDNNNSFSTAQQLSNGSVVTGSVDIDDDMYDYYKINLRNMGFSGDLLNIHVTITDLFGGVLLTLFNPEKYRIGDDVCVKPMRDPLERSIFACYTGSYYIRIGMEDNPFITSSNYQLSVNFSSQFMITDNDNTNATASTISAGNHGGKILEPVYDYLDLYNISLTVGTSTTQGLEVILDNKDDKYLAVYKPDGTLRMLSDFTILDTEEKEIVRFAADQTGGYRIAAGVSGAPLILMVYSLNITVVPDIPPDFDYDEEHATRVYDGTKLDAEFGSDFDLNDFYVIQLNDSDNLTVSILYKDKAPGDLDINIYELGKNPINSYIESKSKKGVWTYGIANKDQTDYYIRVNNQNLSKLVDYTILFSLSGENLWFVPLSRNNTNLDFSMQEDSINISSVNLTHIFYDPDSPLTFDSPTHPNGIGTNVDFEILDNGTVKFMPHKDFFGYEIINFSATDIDSNILYWEVNVTVLPVNDRPMIEKVLDKVVGEDSWVDIPLKVTDVDDSDFIFYDNTELFDVDSQNLKINFTPTNDHVGLHVINITVSDGELNNSVEFNLRIKNTNDPPEFVKIAGKNSNSTGSLELNAFEDEKNQYSVQAIDIDHDAGVMDVLKFLLNATDPAFEINETTGNFTFTPEQKHVGQNFVTLTVDDGNGGIAEQKIVIEVIDIVDPPTTPIFKIKITNSTINCTITDIFDEDGDVLSFKWDFGDGSNLSTKEYSCEHEYKKSGIYNVTVRAMDGRGGYADNWRRINITWKPEPDNGKNGNDSIVDEDNDELDDNWELEYFGNLTQGKNDDFDGDGYSNYEEYKAKTDPTKNTDRPLDDDDTKEKDKDSEEPLPLLYVIGIIGIINLVLIILILFFIFMRKKRLYGEEPRVGRRRSHYRDRYREEDYYPGPRHYKTRRDQYYDDYDHDYDYEYARWDDEEEYDEYDEDYEDEYDEDFDYDYDDEEDVDEEEYDDEDYYEEDMDEEEDVEEYEEPEWDEE